jgi:hypothetical protein
MTQATIATAAITPAVGTTVTGSSAEALRFLRAVSWLRARGLLMASQSLSRAACWNQLDEWLRRLDALRRAA